MGHRRRHNKVKFNAVLCAIILAGVFILPTTKANAEYPERAVHIIVQYPPGGSPDMVARVLADRYTKIFGQPFIVENRPGAGGSIATRYVAKSKPDGYTLLLASDGPIVIAPSLFTDMTYDPIAELTPVTLAATSAFALLTSASGSLKSLGDLIAQAKENPGKLNYGSSGIGTQHHLAAELLKTTANLDIVHVPYKGFTPGTVDVISGQVEVIFGSVPASIKYVNGGKMRALAVTGKERFPGMPDVPTMMELGMENYNITAWFGLMAPTGTPQDIINKINAASEEILADDEVAKMFGERGLDIVAGGPDIYAKRIEADVIAWGKIIKDANVEVGK